MLTGTSPLSDMPMKPDVDDVLQHDAWLTNMLGCDASRLTGTGWTAPELQKALDDSGDGFAWTRVPTARIELVERLSRVGFTVVDTNLTFEKALEEQGLGAGAVRAASADDENDVARIARESFRYTRFHLDPKITDETADAIKEEWARNYFRGKRGDQLLVGLDDGCLAGFILLLESTTEIPVIDLIAVEPASQGRGIASKLINNAVAACPAAKTMRVGTQAANIRSVRLYEKLGFRLVDSAYVLHWHSETGNTK